MPAPRKLPAESNTFARTRAGSMLFRAAVSSLITVAALTPAASAQWSATVLHPADAWRSLLRATSGAAHGGDVDGRAALWNRDGSSWVDLHPESASYSAVDGIHGTQQVGYTAYYADYLDTFHAALWNGTSDSWVDLNPAGALTSQAYATSGTHQVGEARFADYIPRASLWSGSADSWTDLTPAHAQGGVASAIHGSRQGGHILINNYPQAGFWTGAAESWVSLHPEGARYSFMTAISDTHEAGYVVGRSTHAVLWSGTTDSLVDLHPEGASGSYATAIAGEFIIGYITLPGSIRHAGVWSGTPESWEDLAQYVPSEWSWTSAHAAWRDDTTLYVAGSAYNPETNQNGAILWTRPIPTPGAAALLALGLLAAGRRRSHRGDSDL